MAKGVSRGSLVIFIKKVGIIMTNIYTGIFKLKIEKGVILGLVILITTLNLQGCRSTISFDKPVTRSPVIYEVKPILISLSSQISNLVEEITYFG